MIQKSKRPADCESSLVEALSEPFFEVNLSTETNQRSCAELKPQNSAFCMVVFG
jgi:hypothetical protein